VSGFYLAVESFRDDDGDLIEAGKTLVLDQADCYRQHPGRFKPVERGWFQRVFAKRPPGHRI
jgi:hypothetical protein